MSELGVLAVLVVGLVACGGSAAPPPAQPGQPAAAAAPAAAPEPSCAEVATRVVETIASERGGRFREEAADMTEIVRTRCHEDDWTVESRRCMARAASGDEARNCFEQLTEAQQDALKRDEKAMRKVDRQAEPAGGGGAPPEEAPVPTMAPPSPSPPPPAPAAKKKKSAPKADKAKAKSDPCEGGE